MEMGLVRRRAFWRRVLVVVFRRATRAARGVEGNEEADPLQWADGISQLSSGSTIPAISLVHGRGRAHVGEPHRIRLSVTRIIL
jgi:hypothetical protein